LHYAVKNKDNYEIIKLLIDNGAHVNFENNKKETSLHLAVKIKNNQKVI
jgi:ankyrin repeat protein